MYVPRTPDEALSCLFLYITNGFAGEKFVAREVCENRLSQWMNFFYWPLYNLDILPHHIEIKNQSGLPFKLLKCHQIYIYSAKGTFKSSKSSSQSSANIHKRKV